MKVYVIQRGYYSDRHIIGVVETKEEAIRIAEALKDSWDRDSVAWREYDTKQFVDHRFRYTVERMYDNTWHIEYDEYGAYKEYEETAKIYDDNYVVYAYNTQQAIKIAQDMYYEEQAQKEGLV